jgi:hypothetical protein
VVALVYLRCLGNGFVFDDHEMILANRYLGQWSFLWKGFVNDSWWFRDPAHLPQSHYYRPLQDLWLGVNFHLFGTNPAGWHALMVLLHLGAVALVFGVARLLTGDPTASLIAAALFGLMPIHAEPIVWASAIPESLAGTLELAAFYFFLRWRAGHAAKAMWWSLACFAAALLSHESAAAFPLLPAAYALFLSPSASRHHEQSFPRTRATAALRMSLPYFLCLAAYLLIRWRVLGFISRPDVSNHAGAAQVLMTIPAVIAGNLRLLIAPWQAGPSHRIDWVTAFASRGFVLPVVGLSMLAGAAWLAIRQSTRRGLYCFCLAWVFITMLPVLNLATLYPQALISDRYLYLASFGWCLLVGQLGAGAIARRGPWALAAAAAIGVIAAVYAASLWQVQSFWHDEIALFSRCLDIFPDNGFCHNRLGMALFARGDLSGADRELRIAFALDPDDYAAEYDRGLVLARMEQPREAASLLDAALHHLHHPPPAAFIALARLYDKLGDTGARDASLKRAAQLAREASPGAAP